MFVFCSSFLGYQLLYTGSSFWSVVVEVTSSNCDTNSRCPESATSSVNVPNASQLIVGGGALGAGGTPGQAPIAPRPNYTDYGSGSRIASSFSILFIALAILSIF